MAHPVILFDGACALCARVVVAVIRRDPAGHFRFAALQSVAAERLLRAAGAEPPPPGQPLDTMMVVDGDQVLVRADAALRVARDLAFPWPLFAFCRIIPRHWRDGAYRWLAAHRHRWFGAPAVCLRPTPATLARFVEGADVMRVPTACTPR